MGTINASPISNSRVTGQPIGGGMGLFGKFAFKHAGAGGNSVSQHASSYAPPLGGTSPNFQKKLVEGQKFIDKREKSLEKKANGYRAKVANELLSKHPNPLKVIYNAKKMADIDVDWNYTATKDFGDVGAKQAEGMLIGLRLVRADVKSPKAINALNKLQQRLEDASRTDADIDSDELESAESAMRKAEADLKGTTTGTPAYTDAQNALDRATQRHAAAQKRVDEPGQHATHSNIERATEAGEKLVKQLSDMHGKTPEQQKESRAQLKQLMELAVRADGYTGAGEFLMDDASDDLKNQIGHLLDIQKTTGNSNRALAQIYAAFLYGVVAAADNRHNAATGTEVGKIFAKLPKATSDSVFAKLEEWKQPVVPVNVNGNAPAQPVRMNEAAGPYRDDLAQVARNEAQTWFRAPPPNAPFHLVAPALKALLSGSVTDWGDAKLQFTDSNGVTGHVDFTTFKNSVAAQGIFNVDNAKALRTHMAAQWVKTVIAEMDVWDAANPLNTYLPYLNQADRASLRARADQAMQKVAPAATAASIAAATARTDALKLELGGLADYSGHVFVLHNPDAFKQIAPTLVALKARKDNELGSTTFAQVPNAIWGDPFRFDFNVIFKEMFVDKGIDPTLPEGVKLKNYLAARWIQGVLDAVDTAELVEANKLIPEVDLATRAALRKLADAAAPRPVAKPTPGVPVDWANKLAGVEVTVHNILGALLPDQPQPPPMTAADLATRAGIYVTELALLSGATKGKLDSVPGITMIKGIIDTLVPTTADPALIPAMREDIAATVIKTLLAEFEVRQRRQALAPLVGYDVKAIVEAGLSIKAMQKLHALTFEPNLQPESAWTFKLADTRKSATNFMADLDTGSQTDVKEAKKKLESMITMLNQVADKGMPWPLPTKFGFDKIIDDLVPVEAPFDQVGPMSIELAKVWVQQLAKEIEDRESNLATTPLPYFGTGAHRSAKLKQEARDQIASLKPGTDHTPHMNVKRTSAGWSITQLANAKSDATLHWTQLNAKPDATALATRLGADLERLSTVKRGDLAKAMEEIKAFKGIVDNCLKPIPADKALAERMRNDLAVAFLRQLALVIEADIGMCGLVKTNRRPGMLDDLIALRADKSLL